MFKREPKVLSFKKTAGNISFLTALLSINSVSVFASAPTPNTVPPKEAVAVPAKANVLGSGNGTVLPPKLAKIFGGDQDDVLSSMLVDAQGNAYFIGETKSFFDKTYWDIFVVKMKPDGTLAWSKTFGTNEEDGVKGYIDGKHGGPARMAALGPDGSLYVAGRSAIKGRKEPHGAVLFKVTPTGNLAWSQVWRPHWNPQMHGQAWGSVVAVSGNKVYLAGSTGAGQTTEEGMIFLASFDAATGQQKSILAVDPNPMVNDRVFSIVAHGNHITLAGWNGKTNRGQLSQFSDNGTKLTHDWTKRVPLSSTGSTLCDIERDSQGNFYLAGDIHGAGTNIEIIKLGPDYSFKWSRRYNTGASGDKNNTRTVRVIGDKVIVGGRIGYMGTQTDADRMFGDSLVLVYSTEGVLLKELYHFTGTANDVVAMDAVTSVGSFGKSLYLGGNIWPYGKNHVGQWRDATTFNVKRISTEGTAGEYLFDDVGVAKTLDLSSVAAKPGSSFESLAWKDVLPQMFIGTPLEASAKGRQTQFNFFIFDGIL